MIIIIIKDIYTFICLALNFSKCIFWFRFPMSLHSFSFKCTCNRLVIWMGKKLTPNFISSKIKSKLCANAWAPPFKKPPCQYEFGNIKHIFEVADACLWNFWLSIQCVYTYLDCESMDKNYKIRYAKQTKFMRKFISQE